MMKTRYLITTTSVSAQKNSDTTPSTLSGSTGLTVTCSVDGDRHSRIA